MVNRRTVIQGLASAPLLLGAAPLLSAAPAVRALNKSNVLVIGAGLSGLSAAVMLESQGVNLRVIEGRQRIGGRVFTLDDVPGKPETGGTGASPAYARWIDAARTNNVPLTDMTPILAYLFKSELVLGNEIIPAKSWPTHPRNPFPKESRHEMPWQFASRAIAQGNPLKTVDAWQDPANAYLDISIYEWLTRQGMTDAIIDLAYNTNIGAGRSAYDASALAAFAGAAVAATQQQFVKSSGVGGYRATNGNQRVPEALARTLKHEVEFGKDVVGIRSTPEGVETHCADGTIYRSDHVVCSIPLSVLRRISIDPMLTGRQAKLVKTLDYQHLTLVHMVANEPFWDIDGLTPNMFTDGVAGRVMAQRRGKTPDEVTSLVSFISGPPATWLDQMNESDAKAMVVAHIEKIRPAAKGRLEALVYKSWRRDPFAGGTWAFWQPGQLSELAADAGKPHGRIHFCGEHTAVVNRGGMEGAMESGERVAMEILEAV